MPEPIAADETSSFGMSTVPISRHKRLTSRFSEAVRNKFGYGAMGRTEDVYNDNYTSHVEEMLTNMKTEMMNSTDPNVTNVPYLKYDLSEASFTLAKKVNANTLGHRNI